MRRVVTTLPLEWYIKEVLDTFGDSTLSKLENWERWVSIDLTTTEKYDSTKLKQNPTKVKPKKRDVDRRFNKAKLMKQETNSRFSFVFC